MYCSYHQPDDALYSHGDVDPVIGRSLLHGENANIGLTLFKGARADCQTSSPHRVSRGLTASSLVRSAIHKRGHQRKLESLPLVPGLLHAKPQNVGHHVLTKQAGTFTPDLDNRGVISRQMTPSMHSKDSDHDLKYETLCRVSCRRAPYRDNTNRTHYHCCPCNNFIISPPYAQWAAHRPFKASEKSFQSSYPIVDDPVTTHVNTQSAMKQMRNSRTLIDETVTERLCTDSQSPWCTEERPQCLSLSHKESQTFIPVKNSFRKNTRCSTRRGSSYKSYLDDLAEKTVGDNDLGNKTSLGFHILERNETPESSPTIRAVEGDHGLSNKTSLGFHTLEHTETPESSPTIRADEGVHGIGNNASLGCHILEHNETPESSPTIRADEGVRDRCNNASLGFHIPEHSETPESSPLIRADESSIDCGHSLREVGSTPVSPGEIAVETRTPARSEDYRLTDKPVYANICQLVSDADSHYIELATAQSFAHLQAGDDLLSEPSVTSTYAENDNSCDYVPKVCVDMEGILSKFIRSEIVLSLDSSHVPMSQHGFQAKEKCSKWSNTGLYSLVVYLYGSHNEGVVTINHTLIVGILSHTTGLIQELRHKDVGDVLNHPIQKHMTDSCVGEVCLETLFTSSPPGVQSIGTTDEQQYFKSPVAWCIVNAGMGIGLDPQIRERCDPSILKSNALKTVISNTFSSIGMKKDEEPIREIRKVVESLGARKGNDVNIPKAQNVQDWPWHRLCLVLDSIYFQKIKRSSDQNWAIPHAMELYDLGRSDCPQLDFYLKCRQ